MTPIVIVFRTPYISKILSKNIKDYWISGTYNAK